MKTEHYQKKADTNSRSILSIVITLFGLVYLLLVLLGQVGKQSKRFQIPEFIDAVEDAVSRIRESPTRYVAIDEDVRQCMTRRFPYGILYTIEPDSYSGGDALQPRTWVLEKS